MFNFSFNFQIVFPVLQWTLRKAKGSQSSGSTASAITFSFSLETPRRWGLSFRTSSRLHLRLPSGCVLTFLSDSRLGQRPYEKKTGRVQLDGSRRTEGEGQGMLLFFSCTATLQTGGLSLCSSFKINTGNTTTRIIPRGHVFQPATLRIFFSPSPARR